MLIDQLPDHERLVIVLKHFEGHTASEIALITSQPIGTSLNNSRARQRLQQSLTKEKINEIDLSLMIDLSDWSELVGHGSDHKAL